MLKICEFEMKTRTEKTKKDSYTKDCEEQPREMKLNIRTCLRTVCSRFVEVFSGSTSMCEKHIPSSVENAGQRGGQIYKGTSETERYEDMVERDQDGRIGRNTVVKKPTQNCYNIPRKA